MKNSNEVRTNEIIARNVAKEGRHLGDVVWMSMSGVNARRSDIRAAFAAEGLPEALAPSDPTPEAAFGMAVNAYGNGEQHNGVFLRRVDASRRGSDVLVLHAVKVAGGLDQVSTLGRVGLSGGALTFVKDPILWSKDANAALAELTSTYSDRVEHATSVELGTAVVAAILGWCGGIRLRDRGNVYWAHATGNEEIRALSRVLSRFGGSYLAILPVHDNREARATVQRAATESFDVELRDIAVELEKFKSADGLRFSTLENRLEAYSDLANRVDMYADILGSKRDELVEKLEAAKEAVRQMLHATDDATS